MRTLFTATAALGLLAFLATASLQPARAQQTSSIMTVTFGSSQVELDNQSDAFAWETVYDSTGIIKHVAKKWCVGPRTVDKHTFKSQVSQVRVEVAHANCATPTMLDSTLPMHGPGAFVVSGHRGHYTFEQRQ